MREGTFRQCSDFLDGSYAVMFCSLFITYGPLKLSERLSVLGLCALCDFIWELGRGGDLRGLGNDPSQNLRWGTPMHSSPNILRSCVVGCARKYEQSKKRCRK